MIEANPPHYFLLNILRVLKVQKSRSQRIIMTMYYSHPRIDLSPASSIWQAYWQYQTLALFLTIAVMCMVTRFITTRRFQKALSSNALAKWTPPLPYSIPVVGHALSMGLNIIEFNRYIAFAISRSFEAFSFDADREKGSIARRPSENLRFHDRHLHRDRT